MDTIEAKGSPVMTKDAYQNALTRLGFNMPNLSEGASYYNNRLTQNYQLMNTLYRTHWIVRKIVDVVPEDMCKNWIKLNTQIDPGGIAQVEKVIRRTKTKEKILEGLKWGRLYGGAAAIMLIEGQEDMLDQPLDYRMVMPGSYKGLLVLDRWSGISPGSTVVDDINSTEFGMPAYYQITTQTAKTFYVHHSRVLRFTGNALPMWESQAEMQWGSSVIEPVFDELKKRDNTSYNIANLVFLANLRIYKTDMMADMFSLGDPKVQDDYFNTMQAINMMMSNSSMTIIPREDEMDAKQYTFAGINDIYESFMLDVAGACEIPVTRLFGRSPAGFNATGESDLTNYYDAIEEKQEAYLSPVLDKLLPVIALSTWGAIPDDLDYDYNPLRKADPKENADLSKSISEAIVNVYNASLISQRTALKELRQQNEVTGMWSNITDEDIEKADDSYDMAIEMPGMGGMPPDFKQPSNVLTGDGEFKEEDHPRAENGQFGSGGSGGESSKPDEKEDSKSDDKNDKGKKKEDKPEKVNSLSKLVQAYKNKYEIKDVRQRIKNGGYNIKIKRDDQERHNVNSDAYKEYLKKRREQGMSAPSYFTRDVEAEVLQRLGNEENILKFRSTSSEYPHEIMKFEEPVGKVGTEGNKTVDTNCVNVVYSKKGIHFYPVNSEEVKI